MLYKLNDEYSNNYHIIYKTIQIVLILDTATVIGNSLGAVHTGHHSDTSKCRTRYIFLNIPNNLVI